MHTHILCVVKITLDYYKYTTWVQFGNRRRSPASAEARPGAGSRPSTFFFELISFFFWPADFWTQRVRAEFSSASCIQKASSGGRQHWRPHITCCFYPCSHAYLAHKYLKQSTSTKTRKPKEKSLVGVNHHYFTYVPLFHRFYFHGASFHFVGTHKIKTPI